MFKCPKQPSKLSPATSMSEAWSTWWPPSRRTTWYRAFWRRSASGIECSLLLLLRQNRFDLVHERVHARDQRLIGRGRRQVNTGGLDQFVGIIRTARLEQVEVALQRTRFLGPHLLGEQRARRDGGCVLVDVERVVKVRNGRPTYAVRVVDVDHTLLRPVVALEDVAIGLGER